MRPALFIRTRISVTSLMHLTIGVYAPIYTCSYTFVKHPASITLLVNLGERSRSPSQRPADARVLDAMAFYDVGCGQ